MVPIDTDSRVAQIPGQLATPEAPKPRSLIFARLRPSLARMPGQVQPLVIAVPTPLTSYTRACRRIRILSSLALIRPRSSPPQTTIDPPASCTDTSFGPPVVTPRTCLATWRGSSPSTAAAAATAGLPRRLRLVMLIVSSGRPGGRRVTSRTLTPNGSTRAYPPCTASSKTGLRNWIVITSVVGQCLLTSADRTRLSRSTRRAMAPVSTQISGWPWATRAAASTCPAETASPVPATRTERTTSSVEPSSAQAITPTITTAVSANHTAFQCGLGSSRPRQGHPTRRGGRGRRGLRCPGRAPLPPPGPGPPGRRGGPETVLAIRRLPPLPQCRHDQRAERRHIPGAHGQDEVPGPGGRRHRRGQVRALRDEARPPARH